MDSIGGMLNPIGKMPKHTTKSYSVMVLLEKANGILMETIGISVMFLLASIVFLAGLWLWAGKLFENNKGVSYHKVK